MLSIKDMKSEKLEKALSKQLQNDLAQPEINEDDLFVLADYDESAAEKSGYSNYSYWSSTLRVFFKNKVAVFLLIVLVSLLVFTILQPYLPGQYPANLIINNPADGIQLSQVKPSLTNTMIVAPQGTTFTPADGYYENDHLVMELKKRSVVTVTEYGEEWCKVSYESETSGTKTVGYIYIGGNTDVALPDDPTAVPYTIKLTNKTNVYSEPVELWYAVSNVLSELKSEPTKKLYFTVMEYGDDWMKVSYKDKKKGELIGYVKNDFQTTLEQLPVNVSLLPCTIHSDADLKVYAEESTSSELLVTIPMKTDFSLAEYGEKWCRIVYQDAEKGEISGYIKNGASARLVGLPTDPTAVPYEAYSYSNIRLHAEPVDYSYDGSPLFAKVSDFTVNEDGTITARSDVDLCLLPSSRVFLFGTNNTGQDLWARIWGGTRTSLFIGFTVACVEAIIGILVGVLWGYVRQLDRILTEVYNVIDNIPNTIILILISYILKPSMQTLIFAMCLTGWLGMARFIRNQIVIIRDRDYNLASRCLGTSTWRIIMKNLLPYLVSVIGLRMALSIPGAIGSEVFITYIGLGLPVDTPSLGNLINVGRKLVGSPSLMYQLIFPTLVLSIVTISFYIIGNAFADAADPKNHV